MADFLKDVYDEQWQKNPFLRRFSEILTVSVVSIPELAFPRLSPAYDLTRSPRSSLRRRRLEVMAQERTGRARETRVYFPSGGASLYRPLGTLRSNDADGDENVKKQ